MILTNTIDAFKSIDKNDLLKNYGKNVIYLFIIHSLSNQFIKSILSNQLIDLNQFILITFADLKKFKFYYWFAFPVLSIQNTLMNVQNLKDLDFYQVHRQILNHDSFKEFRETTRNYYKSLDSKPSEFCWDTLTKKCVLLHEIKELSDNFIFCLVDSASSKEYPGIAIRQTIAYLKIKFNPTKLSLICMRDDVFNQNKTISSLFVSIQMQDTIGKYLKVLH